MHKFNYPAICYEDKKINNVTNEFLFGWCHVLQYKLVKDLCGAEPYEILEKSDKTNG